MTDWITDIDLAPRNSEWVLGAVPISEDDPEGPTVSEVIIFDSGVWTDTSGMVVNPVAWAKITPFKPSTSHPRYEWEDDSQLREFADAVSEHAPKGYVIMGLAVGHFDNGEGSLILVDEQVDPEMAVWTADVMKDVLGDAQHFYDLSVTAITKKMVKH